MENSRKDRTGETQPACTFVIHSSVGGGMGFELSFYEIVSRTLDNRNEGLQIVYSKDYKVGVRDPNRAISPENEKFLQREIEQALKVGLTTIPIRITGIDLPRPTAARNLPSEQLKF